MTRTSRTDRSRPTAPMHPEPAVTVRWAWRQRSAALPVHPSSVVRLVPRIRGGRRRFLWHRAGVDDQLVAVGGVDGERDAEWYGTLGAVPVAGADHGDDRHAAIVRELQEPGLVVVRRAHHDAVPVPDLPQAEFLVEVAVHATRDVLGLQQVRGALR